MPQPNPYTRSYDFTDFQEQYPNQPLPAAPVDANLDNIAIAIRQVINRLILVQRDDGKLKNQLVTIDSLSNDVRALLGSNINPRGNWVTATAYAVLDLVNVNGVTYICAVAHTSGTFVTDRNAGKWVLFSNPAADSGSSFFQKFSGDGAEDTFVLSDDLGTDENALLVFYDAGGADGYQIQKPDDFTVNGTSLVFDTAPALGTDNILVFAPSRLLGAIAAAAAEASAAQLAAETAQTNAEAAETGAEGFRDEAQGFRNEAEGFRDEAEAFRDQAEVLATGLETLVDVDITNAAQLGKSFAAIGDGTVHPLSEFYPNLAAAQVDYPVANDLKNSIDQTVIHQMMSDQQSFKLPKGKIFTGNYAASITGKDFFMSQHPSALVKGFAAHSGTAQGGGVNTITLDALASSVNDKYNTNHIVEILTGPGAGESSLITDYDGTSKQATVANNWRVQPTSSSTFIIRTVAMFTLVDCNPYMDNVTVDLDYQFQNFIYSSGSSEFIGATINNFEGRKAGWETARGTNLASVMWFNGKVGIFRISGYKSSLVRTVGNGHFGDNEGGARALVFTPSSSANKFDGICYDFRFDAEGSYAEELDVFNINTNVIPPSKFTFVNPVILYNGEVRRCIKIHSCDVYIINPQIHKAADFVTAPTAAATTNVGAKNLACVDFAGSGEGSIFIEGGYLDVSGYPSGYLISAGSTSAFVRADGTEFVGAIYQYSRHDPERKVTGTARGGGASTITLDEYMSSQSNNYYNGCTVEIISGTGAGQTGTAASYVGATRVLTMTAPWATPPDTTSVYSIYIAQLAEQISYRTGSVERGSGVQNCRFTDGRVAVQIAADYGYVKNCVFDDPVYYAFWVNATSKVGIRVEDNTVITRTTNRLYDGFRCCPIQGSNTEVIIRGNLLSQKGNANHRANFIEIMTSTMTGTAERNMAPASCTPNGGASATCFSVINNTTSNVRIGDNCWPNLQGLNNDTNFYTAAASNGGSLGKIGYVNSSGTITLADASAEATSKGQLVMYTNTIAASAKGVFLEEGLVVTSGLTPGDTLYLSETTGDYTNTPPSTAGTIVRVIGYALSATLLKFKPSDAYIEN